MDELLDQQRKSRKLQQELLFAREDVKDISKNCTLGMQRLKTRYDATLRALHDRVVTGEEAKSLLERNIDERAKLESSLTAMQDRAYNVSLMLKATKQKLRDVLGIATSQRDEITRIKRELQQFKGDATSAAAAKDRASNQDQSEADTAAEATETTAEAAEPKVALVSAIPAWTEHRDKNSGRIYWYNAATKTSQWEKPVEFVTVA